MGDSQVPTVSFFPRDDWTTGRLTVGGYDGQKNHNELYVFDLHSMEWRQPEVTWAIRETCGIFASHARSFAISKFSKRFKNANIRK